MAWYRFRHRTSFAFPRLRQTRVVQGGGMSRSERSSLAQERVHRDDGGGAGGPPRESYARRHRRCRTCPSMDSWPKEPSTRHRRIRPKTRFFIQCGAEKEKGATRRNGPLRRKPAGRPGKPTRATVPPKEGETGDDRTDAKMTEEAPIVAFVQPHTQQHGYVFICTQSMDKPMCR